MLRLWNSPKPLLSGLVEHECPRCHRPVELPLGALCGNCHASIDRRARKAARLVSGLSSLAVGSYLLFTVPPTQQSRLVAAAGILMWYVLTHIMVRRIMQQYTR